MGVLHPNVCDEAIVVGHGSTCTDPESEQAIGLWVIGQWVKWVTILNGLLTHVTHSK